MKAESRERGDGQGRSTRGGQQTLRQHVHGTSTLQACAQHQYTGHGDNGGVAEAGKGLRGGHQTQQHAGQQCAHGNHVMSPATPEEHHDSDSQYKKDDELVLDHDA
jgi:hypothetical protein